MAAFVHERNYTVWTNRVTATVTLVRAAGSTAYAVEDCKRHALSRDELDLLQLNSQQDALVWRIPQDKLDEIVTTDDNIIERGDTIAFGGETWVVLSATRTASGDPTSTCSCWRCACVKSR